MGGQPIDGNLRDVAIALITVAGGLLTAIVVARITTRGSYNAERARSKRELYASFLRDADGLRDTVHAVAGGGTPAEGWPTHIVEGQRTLSEIRLIAPKMAVEAGRLWAASSALIDGVLKSTEPGEMDVDLSHFSELDDAYRVAGLAFLDAAVKDLE